MTKIDVVGPRGPRSEEILTPEALELLAGLQRALGATREDLLARRQSRLEDFARGAVPQLLDETREVRDGDWRVAPAPADLDDRRVEITGPVERKMMINALNSGASVFMADFEDSLSPTWSNVVEGQANLIDAVRRRIDFTSPEGKQYRLAETTATLVVRPRGWHLEERHSTSASPCSTTPASWWTAARVRTSICPSWRATARRGSGTTPSCSPRTLWESRAAPSAPRC